MGESHFESESEAEDELRSISVGRTITLFRIANNLSTKTLANLSNIDQFRLVDLERGFDPVTMSELVVLAGIFDVSTEKFLTVVEKLEESWRTQRRRR